MDAVSESLLSDAFAAVAACREQISQRIVGQTELVDGMIVAFLAGGHALLEGVPGLAKTLAVKTLADASDMSFKRIQFTPDLLPADITGTLIYEQANASFSVRKGPLFSNIVLADEINRAPAKVQSALLESMAEGGVTIGDQTYPLPEPFFVLATQNPIEQDGTYPLPEAELDRFLMKIVVPYPSYEEEFLIVRNSDSYPNARVRPAFNAESLVKYRRAIESVMCDDKIIRYIISIIAATRPKADARDKVGRDNIFKYISCGASPRGGIGILRCARVRAFLSERTFVTPDDVKAVALNVLRHRIATSYEAEADGVRADDIIERVLSYVAVP